MGLVVAAVASACALAATAGTLGPVSARPGMSPPPGARSTADGASVVAFARVPAPAAADSPAPAASSSALAAPGQFPSPGVPPIQPSPAPPPVFPGSSSSSGTSTLPTPPATLHPHPGSGTPASPAPAGRFHLHRPGTDVDGDLLTGNAGSEIYVLKGNVELHSDPTVDREVAEASESTQPLTLTADEIDVDRGGLTYTAKGHVHFTQGTRSGSADLAMLDEHRHAIDLIGNANVYDGDRRAAADKLHYDMQSKGFLGAGDVRIFEPLPTPNPNAVATPTPKHKRRIPI